jgi:TRAP-type C4-dicarboxylate transport system substrate-binding protein
MSIFNTTSMLSIWGAVFLAASPVTAETVLRYAGTLPVTHHLSEAQQTFADIVAEKTNGELKIEVYPAGQLYKAHDIPTAVVTGAIDIGFNLTNVWTRDAISDVNDIPFLFRDAAHAKEAWVPDGQLFELYSETLAARQMKPLGVMFFGSLFDISNRGKPLVSPEDFAGMKIRAYGALSSEAVRALGGSPTTLDPGEMYLGLQNGTIDGAITGLTSIDARKLWEAGQYATIAQAAFGVFAVNMNLTKFNSLTETQQTALMEASREVFQITADESARQDEKSLAFLQEKIEVVVLNAEQKAQWAEILAPVVEGWQNRASDSEKTVIAWIHGL